MDQSAPKYQCIQFVATIHSKFASIYMHTTIDLLAIRIDWIYLTVVIVLLVVDGNNSPDLMQSILTANVYCAQPVTNFESLTNNCQFRTIGKISLILNIKS